jgi:sortase B
MKNKIYNIIKIAVILILVTMLIYSSTNIIIWIYNSNKNKNMYKELISEIVVENNDETQTVTIDFEKLLTINKDTVGWIRFNNKKIDYPIVQADDNNYYLKKSFDNKTDSYGSIFLDYRNRDTFSDANTIIYGHNMQNDAMFGSLRETLEESFFENSENRIIEIFLPAESIKYEIFSIYLIEQETYSIPKTKEEFTEFLNTIKERSTYDFDSEVDTGDRILTLSTCGDEVNSSKRLVIHAKAIYE